jgi:ribosomal protein S18 acetylase RimI-like enzyme
MESTHTVRQMSLPDVQSVVALQRSCFPPPFPEDLLWQSDHIERHLQLFPQGQFVATSDDKVIASASACIISEETWQAHNSWDETVGGPFLDNHAPHGSTLYGLDVSVHPAWRGRGVGRNLYEARFDLVKRLGLARYGTACRMPSYALSETAKRGGSVEQYAERVVSGQEADRTLSPLLRYGLTFLGVLRDYMEDIESGNAAALLEWKVDD